MAAVNTALAILTILGGVLCARAFLPHVRLLGPRPVDNLARGLLICAFSAFPRTAFWDLAWPGLRDVLTGGIATNILFNAVMVVGIYFILRARWLTIPEGDRERYNLITAAFYPSNLFPRLRRDD
jgi:hypothetical protein